MKCPWCGKQLKIEIIDQRNIIMNNGKPYPSPYGYQARCPDMICGYFRSASYLPEELKRETLDFYQEEEGRVIS